MAKNQGIVRLRGSIDGVTYTEGVNGRLSRSKSSLNKAKMDANPKFNTLRMLQKELGMYSKFGALLRSGIKNELLKVKPFKGVQRLNKLLNQIKNADGVNRLGGRNVVEGLLTVKGKGLLTGFDFYGKTTVSSLMARDFVIDMATGEASISAFNPLEDLVAPVGTTHVGFKAVMMGMDPDNFIVSPKRSDEIYLPLSNTAADLILQPVDLPSVSTFVYYMVQVLFYKEINGFRELAALDSCALSILEIVDN